MRRICAVLLLLLLIPNRASACTCDAGWGQPEAIFRGTVIGIDSPSRYGLLATVLRNVTGQPYSKGVVFDVHEAWVGVEKEQITIQNGVETGCALSLERGASYFVRATRFEDGALRIGTCSGVESAETIPAEFTNQQTLPLEPVPLITPYELLVVIILFSLLYWWVFMVRAIRANPLRF